MSNRASKMFVIVPAYNEEATIGDTVRALQAQTRVPDRIVVVPNNCSSIDRTAEVARELGATVIDAGVQPDKKAGAINFALNQLEAELVAGDSVLIMDGDSTLAPQFCELAESRLVAGVGGVGGIFQGRSSDSLLGRMQSMEFHRYSATAKRHGGRAFVLTGVGTLFSWSALLDVRAARLDGRLPKGSTSFYDTYSLTEDNEMTLALQVLDYQTISPEGLTAITDVMESTGKLVEQRKRWYLGALRNIKQYGTTMPGHMRWVYWRQQGGLFLSALIVMLYAVLLTLALVTQHFDFSPVWLVPSIVLLTERVYTVRQLGWRERLIAGLFVPEQIYTCVLMFGYLRAVGSFIRGSRGVWVLS